MTEQEYQRGRARAFALLHAIATEKLPLVELTEEALARFRLETDQDRRAAYALLLQLFQQLHRPQEVAAIFPLHAPAVPEFGARERPQPFIVPIQSGG